ncbi:MAG: hypothetical protein H6673_10895 [Anaerolineales bacterium]|nr:hypothetical protein [Anaerolineales bacterium]
MRSKKHHVVVLLLLVALVVGACRTSGDEDERGGPTAPSFPSATPRTNETVTPGPSPTTLPISTSGPTPTRFAGFPTQAAPPTVPSRYPEIMQIVYPITGQEVAGNVVVSGSASHPDFIQYALEYGPDPNPSNLWYPITPQAVTVPVINNALGAWNTTLVQDGTYQVRLHVYLTGNREVTNVIVTGLRVRNTSAPQPSGQNTSPTISPIAPLNIQRGQSATIALGIYDADGDPTTFIATSDNTAIAAVSPNGQAITVTGLSVGVATIRIRVTDGRGGQAQTSFLATVVEPPTANNPPNIAPIPGQTLTQNATLNVPVSISDPDGDTVTFTVTSAAPQIATVSKGTDNASINIAGFSPGSTSVTVTATDARGQSRSAAFTVVVNPPAPTNDPPSIGAIPGQTLEQGKFKDLTLSISDPNGDATTYTLTSSAPAVVGVSDLGGNKLRITGNAEGSSNVTVTVRDARGATASTIFSVTVTAPPAPNQSPTIAAIGNQTIEVGQTLNIDLTMSDPDGDSLTFSSTSGDTSLVTTGQVDSNTLSITGVAQGSTSITVAVGDGRGGSATTSFNVQVNPATVPNQNPTIDSIPDQAVEVAKSVKVGLSYSDPDGDSMSLFANSSNAGIATVFQSADFELTVNGVSTGSATITVTINDARGGTATKTFSVNVTAANQNPTISAAGDQTCSAGDTLNLSISYSDPDGDPVSVTPSSDNPAAATASVAGNSLTVNCVAAGGANITLLAEDGQGGSASATFNVNVGAVNQNPVIDNVPDQACQVGDTLNLVVNYSDPDGDPVTVDVTSDNAGVASGSLVGNALTVACSGEGLATISLNASDGKGGTASDTFAVSVSAAPPPNQNPTIDPIGGQTCQEGDVFPLTINYGDPDGDTVTVTVNSDSPGTANASLTGTTLTVNCSSAGLANITLVADDGKGGTAMTSFGVTVSAAPPPNQNPTIDPIGGQACQEGESPVINITYGDPDGNPVTAFATSDNPAVANASVAGNTLTISCFGAGGANITVSVDDGLGGTASTSFGVTVSAAPPPNQNPTIDPIGGQACQEGESPVINITYGDPDGNPVTAFATSDNPAVANASVAGNTLTISCFSAGGANITVSVDDGLGGSASTSFGVTVSAAPPPNQNPTIDPIGGQACQVGDAPVIGITYGDPDGNPVTVSTSSDNPAVASASVAGNSLSLACSGEGSANITVLVDDGLGGTNSTSFPVTVSAVAPPPFDVTVYPEIPNIGALVGNLQGVYNNGLSMGRLATNFSVVGDDSLNGPNFMDPIAAGNYNLGNYGFLEGTAKTYNFTFQSVAIGTAWTPATLLDPSQADPGLCSPGETPLACEIHLTNPVVVFVSFAPNSINGTPVATFKAQLEAVVDTALSMGTIPVLVTLPNDGTLDGATLAQYNEAIVQAATERTSNPNQDVPLWNLYNTMQGASSGVYAVSPAGAADYGDASLTYGVNRRGLAALQILAAFDQAFP